MSKHIKLYTLKRFSVPELYAKTTTTFFTRKHTGNRSSSPTAPYQFCSDNTGKGTLQQVCCLQPPAWGRKQWQTVTVTLGLEPEPSPLQSLCSFHWATAHLTLLHFRGIRSLNAELSPKIAFPGDSPSPRTEGATQNAGPWACLTQCRATKPLLGLWSMMWKHCRWSEEANVCTPVKRFASFIQNSGYESNRKFETHELKLKRFTRRRLLQALTYHLWTSLYPVLTTPKPTAEQVWKSPWGRHTACQWKKWLTANLRKGQENK